MKNPLTALAVALRGRRLATEIALLPEGDVIVLGDVPGGAEAGATKGRVRSFPAAAAANGARASIVIAARGSADARSLVAPGGALVRVGALSSDVVRPAAPAPAAPAAAKAPCLPCQARRMARGHQ